MLLLQEEFKDDPWKMLVACILLNQTNGKQVKKVIYNLFEHYPDPETMAKADPMMLGSILTPLGLQNVKSKNLTLMSKMCLEEDWKEHVSQLPGIGRYGLDSWEIFQNKNIDIEVKDKELTKYLEDVRSIKYLTVEEKLKRILGSTYGGPSLSLESGQFVIYVWGDAPVGEDVLARADTLEECCNIFMEKERIHRDEPFTNWL